MKCPLRISLAILVVSFCLGGVAVAGPTDDAVAAYERGDYAKALRLLRPLALQGDAKAQVKLGNMCDAGKGAPQDYAEAMKWYRMAAEQGDPSGQIALGSIYVRGAGVPQDYAEATKWYRMAADQGHAGAQYNLGVMCEEGKGGLQDYAEAMTWYRMAADQGHAGGQYNLGVLYLRGSGVPRDYVQAHMWFELATASYPVAEREKRLDAVMNRGIAATQMTRAQIVEAKQLAREWKPKVEDDGN